MRIHNICANDNGETHFRDIDVEMSERGPDGSTSGRLPAAGIYFRTTPADWFFDWHSATRRQYVINLDAPNEITARPASSASARLSSLKMCMERDLSQAVGQMRRSVMIPVGDCE
jgi:hypothetical protein